MDFECGADYDPQLQGDLKINEKMLLKLNKIYLNKIGRHSVYQKKMEFQSRIFALPPPTPLLFVCSICPSSIQRQSHCDWKRTFPFGFFFFNFY